MTAIENRARNFIDSTLYDTEEYEYVRKAFIGGAESEHEELTKWNDPNIKRSIDYKPVEIKYIRNGRISYAIAYICCPELWEIDDTDYTIDLCSVLGWREIHD